MSMRFSSIALTMLIVGILHATSASAQQTSTPPQRPPRFQRNRTRTRHDPMETYGRLCAACFFKRRRTAPFAAWQSNSIRRRRNKFRTQEFTNVVERPEPSVKDAPSWAFWKTATPSSSHRTPPRSATANASSLLLAQNAMRS